MTDRALPEAELRVAAEPVAWGQWIWVALALLLAVVVFFPILVLSPDPDVISLADVWDQDDNYSYGYLIPPLALYFIWEERARLRGLELRGTAWGLVVLFLALGMMLVGMLGGVNYLPRAAAVVGLIGSILWIGGIGWLRALLFPVLFLFLMIPLPKFLFIQIAFPLQLFAASVAEQVLYWLGIPILRTGNVIQLAHTQLEVAEACSGLRSLFALITTGVVFAYFFGRSVLQRVLIVCSSIPIAIFVNAVRVAGTGWLAHSYGLEVATGYYHTLEGFAMFGLAFGLLALIGFGVVSLVPVRRAARAEATT